jgi:ubiquinone/menaquinone biosynthesis C-methylase UbiE
MKKPKICAGISKGAKQSSGGYKMEWFEKLYTKDYIDLCGFGSPEQTKIEAQFIVDVLNLKPESHLLDLCCGFGRHTREISQKVSCQITGTDLSDEYLTLARKNYSAENITYVKGDMRHVNIKNRFDAVTIMFTSFGFFESDEQNERVLGEVNKALKNGGYFLMDNENRFNFVLNDVVKSETSWEKLGNNKYCLIKNEYDIVSEREIFKAQIMEENRIVTSVEYNIRLYSLPELKNMLKRNGFELINVWGDFDKREYSLHSRRLIILARKIKNMD